MTASLINLWFEILIILLDSASKSEPIFKLFKAFINLCACSQSSLLHHAWTIPSVYLWIVWRSTSLPQEASFSSISYCPIRDFSAAASRSFASKLSLSFSCSNAIFLICFSSLLFDHVRFSILSLPSTLGLICSFRTQLAL